MDIERHCPFVADAFLWQPALGEHRLTVCVKATFALIHGRNADIAAHQIALHEDLPWEAQNPSSLYASSDYVPKKQRIDILLTGHAYAPAGNPTTSLTARLQVGTFTKSLRITGDRTWTPTREGPRPSSARPFVSMPLRYERAALGPANPIGIDASQGAALAGRPLPNIQLLDQNGAQQGVPGFGPVPAAVRARRLRMNENLIKWAKLFRSEATPPSIDFDFAFFNAAPPDQQLDTLPEPLDIVLENLHPSIARFSSRIPSIGLRAFRVSPKTGLSYALPLLLDTVLIDSDRSLAILSFRSNTAVNTADERALGKLVITAAEAPQASADMVFAGRDSSPPPLSRPAEANAAPPPQATPPPAAKRDGGTVPLPSALSAQAPPRARGGVGETTITTRENPIDFLKNSNALPKSWTAPLPPSPLNPSASVNIGSLPPSSLVKKPDRDEPGSSTLDSSINSIGFNRALPFVSSTPNPPAPAYPAAPSNHRARSADPDEIGSTTLAAPAATAPGSSILPFGKPLSAAAAPPIESNARASSPPPLRPPEISGTLPLGMRSPPQLSSGLPFQTRGETPPKPPVFNAPPPEPPPFIPPPRSSQPGLSPPPPAVFPPPPRSSQPGLSPPPPAVLPPPMSIEQCASVAAELGARLSPRTEVLRKYQLDEAVFGEAERHWMNAIASESEAGKSDLLELFDERYVQALEKLRGEITLEMYAQLMVGSERGNLRPALAELKLQRPAVLRIERVWKRRISRDAKLAAMAADAIALERKK